MNFTISEFEKMKRCSMLLIGFIGVTFSPIISIIQNSMMTVQAGSVENYTFRELLNNTIWNNMAIFFPIILALVGGHFIDREYVDDTLKNILCIPISMRRMVAGKLCTLGVITILLSLYNFIVTLVVGLLFCRETMAFKECLYGGLQIIGMGICLFIAEMPVIAWCARKQDAFKAGAVLSFVLGYLSIFLKSSVIRNIYPYSAGLSVIQFDTTGFVSDITSGNGMNTFLGIGTMMLLIIITCFIVLTLPKHMEENTKKVKKKKVGERKMCKKF